MSNENSSKGLGTRMRERFKGSIDARELWDRPAAKIPAHPGKLLRKNYLEPHDITAHQLANALHVRLTLIRGLLQGKRRVSADLALRLGYCFDTEPQYWLDLQNAYSLAMAWAKKGAEIEQRVVLYDDMLIAGIDGERRGKATLSGDVDELIVKINLAE